MQSAARRLLFLLLLLPGLRAEAPALLQEIAEKLIHERERWAFTQLVREFDGNRVAVERLERFDPTLGWDRRWRLLELNGRTPTPEEVAAWSERKNRARKRPPKAFSEFIDLDRAQVRSETPQSITYAVPFRRSAGGLFPGEKVDLTLTIDKESREIERAQVSIDESFRVALGLARVIDIDMDLSMSGADKASADAPEKPRGSASAVVNKLGRRFEYHWSDFTRHEVPEHEPAQKEPR
jgi:hypothetical protein